MKNFLEYDGELMGLEVNENHRIFKWSQPNCSILFSVTRMGNGASCHFASDKAGLRYLKQAINDFTTACFTDFDWCKMIIANVKKQSTQRYLSKLGFEPVCKHDGHVIMARRY